MPQIKLEYVIFLTDPELVKELQAAPVRIEHEGVLKTPNPAFFSDPGGLYTSPATAAALYGATIIPATLPNIPKSIVSPWITAVPNVNYPLDQARFERKSGGWFGISWLFPSSIDFIWRGKFAYKPLTSVIDDVEVTPVNMPIRRWIDGFEVSTTIQHLSRDASRHTDGLGFKIVNSSAMSITHTLAENNVGYSSHLSWERFYLRRRGTPTAMMEFWRLTCTPAEELTLGVMPSGQVCVGTGTGSGFVLLATVDLLPDDGEWVKVDLLINLRSGASLRIYKDGALLLNLTGLGGNLANGAAVHTSSAIGALNTGSSTFVLDVDDWFNADQPTSYENIDWLNGTKIVKPIATGYGPADTAGFTASSVHLANKRIGSATRPDDIRTTTASAIIHVLEDHIGYTVERGAIGPVSVLGAVYAQRVSGTGANDYSLGLSIAGAAPTFGAAHTHTGGGSYSRKSYMYQPAAALPNLNVFHPLGLAFRNETGGGVGTSAVANLWVEVELCGVFDQCDVSAASVLTPEQLAVVGNTGHHVSPYPDSPWAMPGDPPLSPVAIKSGTFTGNGTTQLLSFNFPVTWFFCRNLSTVRGAMWWSSMVAPHDGDPLATWETEIIDLKQVSASPAAEDDQEYTYELRVAGSDPQDNQAAATYWYVAFCDPGARFSLNTALKTQRPTVAGSVTSLVNPLFTPECLMAQAEATGNLTTASKSYKGIGNAGGETVRAGTALDADGLSMAAGSVTVGATWASLYAGLMQMPLALFRRDDGSGDPGIPQVLQLATWLGDGSASRTISFPRPSGKRPLFAIIWPSSTGVVGFRDPQNTTVTSYSSTSATWTAIASTGITAGGIDQFTVGSSFNANGVTYNAFILPGSDVAGNGGWSGDGEFMPVEPAAPTDWPHGPAAPEIPEDIPPGWFDPSDPDDPTEPVEPSGEDFGGQCVTASTKVCQQALAVIGVTQPVGDILTSEDPGAYMCRLFYADTVNEVLRDFNWPIFTRYADILLITGTVANPWNGDWNFAYRVPSDCIKARRIVRRDIGRGYDADPPKFSMSGVDSGGRIIGTNYEDPYITGPLDYVHLEYTYRPDCAAAQGDALFREALIYKLASKLAPSCARNKITAAECLAAFEHVKARATVAAAQEKQEGDGSGDAVWIAGR